MVRAKNIPYVSMWALSRENILERSREEVEGIFDLIHAKIPSLKKECIANSVRFETIGNLSLLPDDLQNILDDAIRSTQAGNSTFILALAYGGQDEIIQAVKRCLVEGIDPASLTEKSFLTYLDSGKYPAPDLIVRTGGNIRHSGYFLYQSAYSEYYFTDTLWPDFSQKDFDAAIAFYEQVNRNFGK